MCGEKVIHTYIYIQFSCPCSWMKNSFLGKESCLVDLLGALGSFFVHKGYKQTGTSFKIESNPLHTSMPKLEFEPDICCLVASALTTV